MFEISKITSKKYIILISIAVIILIVAGFILKIKNEELIQKSKQQQKLERFIPIREAKENFDSFLNLSSLSGKFLNFEQEKSEISIASFDTETMKVSTKVFKTDEHTIFSRMTFEFDQSKLFPKEDFQKISKGTQIMIFYITAEKQDEIPTAKLIQVEDPSQSLSSPINSSLPEK